MLGRLASRVWKLGPPTHRYDVLRNISIVVDDGVTLVHDHYRPRAGEPLPTILVRTPYNRADFFASFWYRRFAERGYHVIVQDVRGRFGSSGRFEPFCHERGDGQATIAWIVAQDWYGGRLGMWGASYSGFAQWAVADCEHLQALAPLNSTSEFHSSFLPGGALAFDMLLSWIVFSADNEDVGARAWPAIRRLVRATRTRAAAAWNALPLGRLDEDVVHRPVEFFRTVCAELPADDPFWAVRSHAARVPEARAAVHLMTGWYDVFLAQTLADYARLRAAGRAPHLTIGPFAHSEMDTQVYTLQLGLQWFGRHLKGEATPPGELPVHVFVTGRHAWRDLDVWPPASEPHTCYLGPDGALLAASPPGPAFTRYRYDPADPTPSFGGALLFGQPVVDNRPLEARPDVRTFTGEPLAAPLEVAGAPRVVVFVRCTRAHFDIFARVCEVDPSGRSVNVSDAIVRITPDSPARGEGGWIRVELELSALAHEFAAGHRLRLQISSGAHPRFARNPGTGVSARDAVELRAADVELGHDQDHPSALFLPALRSAPTA